MGREDDHPDNPPEDSVGRPFSAIFQQRRGTSPTKWRIRNSGGFEEWGDEVEAVLRACRELTIPIREYGLGSPVNVVSVNLEASFLDGGLTGESGNYWYSERGAWVEGRRAVLLIALQIGLRVRPSWYRANGLEGVTLEELKAELAEEERKLAEKKREEEERSKHYFVPKWDGKEQNCNSFFLAGIDACFRRFDLGLFYSNVLYRSKVQHRPILDATILDYANWLDAQGHWAAHMLRESIRDFADDKQRSDTLYARFGVSAWWVVERRGRLVLLGWSEGGSPKWLTIAGDYLDSAMEDVHPRTMEFLQLEV